MKSEFQDKNGGMIIWILKYYVEKPESFWKDEDNYITSKDQ